MKAVRVCAVMVAVACVAVPTVFGQRMMGGGPRNYGTSDMAKIFGKNQAFSATAETSITDAKQGTPMQMEMSYAFLKGNLRTEMDMTTMKGSKMPPNAIASMKQMGMDRLVNIYRGDKKVVYMVYPGLKSYCEMTPPQGAPTDKPAGKEPVVTITQVGKDTVDGHPCIENKITITADDGSQHEVLAWNATDLNDFPIKTEMHVEGSTITTHFRDIKLSAPAAAFDPPSDYQRYGSMQEMMMGSMQRMMPQGGGMPPHGGVAPGAGNE